MTGANGHTTPPSPNVLLVDDLPANLLALESILNDLGANLVRAHSGEEALRQCLASDFAVILMDVRMPGIDGYETARLIHGRDRSRHTPVIFVTAHDTNDTTVLQAYRDGAADHLQKPLNADILRAKVGCFIDLHHKTEQIRQLERRERERQLAEERQRWEMDRLREEAAREKAINDELRRLNQEIQQEAAERRQSEARFRQLADAMPQIVWAARPDGHADYFNERWYEFTGFPRGQTGDDVWLPILHPDDVRPCLERWRRSVRTGDRFDIEYRFKDRKTGGYRWHLGRALPVRDEHGQVVRWYGTCTDIDDQKRTQEALREADRQKNEFLAMLAHELRNPLAPLRNGLHILQLAGDNPEVFESARTMMERQVEDLVRLVDDLMDVSRITRGRVQLRKEAVDLAELVNRAVDSNRPLIEARGHGLTVSLPPGPVPVHADATRLVQVLANLINNAAKYTEPGGRIWVTGERAGGEAVVRVQDTGIGISPRVLPYIFDLFVQDDRTLDRSQGGLGIGLTLVRNLVEMHGGSVQAHSDGPGRGSEFVVRLPLPAPAPAAPRPEAAGLVPGAAGCPVLVVDDNVDAAESLATLLRAAGHAVRTAYEATAALEAVQLFPPAVILLDIGLPGMDGYELARELRRRPETERVVLIAVTGYGQDEARQRSQEAGFDHHLVKPVDLPTLQELLTARPVAV